MLAGLTVLADARPEAEAAAGFDSYKERRRSSIPAIPGVSPGGDRRSSLDTPLRGSSSRRTSLELVYNTADGQTVAATPTQISRSRRGSEVDVAPWAPAPQAPGSYKFPAGPPAAGNLDEVVAERLAADGMSPRPNEDGTFVMKPVGEAEGGDGAAA